jgi:hypothetical protein
MGAAIGSLACRGLDCSREVPVTQTAGGSLSMKCGFCGFSCYAQPGTKSARAIRAAMTPEEGTPAAAAPAASSSPGEPPAPAPARPANSVFSLGNL